MTNIITFDPGYGNCKVVFNGRVAVLPSAIVRPRQIGLAAIGTKSHQAEHRVIIPPDTDYVAGSKAWLFGEPLGSMDYTALSGEPKRALFYATLSTLLSPGDYSADLAVGLPVPLLNNEEEAKFVIKAMRASYKTTHVWQTPAGEYRLTINQFKPLPQPLGAYTDWLVTDDLDQREGGAAAEVAIIDLGMNTLDLFVMQGGQIVDRFIGGATVGVRRLLYRLNGHGQDLAQIDHNLRTGALDPNPMYMDAWLDEVLGQIESTWTSLKRFQAVIPAGGGALILGDRLHRALVQKGAAIAWPSDPVATNARGLYKLMASTHGKKA